MAEEEKTTIIENLPSRDDVLANRHSEVMSEVSSMGHSEEITTEAMVVSAAKPKPRRTKSKDALGTAAARGAGLPPRPITTKPTKSKSVDSSYSAARSIGTASTSSKPRPTSAGMKSGMFTMRVNREDGTIEEDWDEYFPRPPSMKNLTDELDPNAEQVAVFGLNTQEGFSIVRILSRQGFRVVAAVRVYTSNATKRMMRIPTVTVKAADTNNEQSLMNVTEGCSRAFIVTKYWEKFDGLEENMATNIIQACRKKGINQIICASFENTVQLIQRNEPSQLRPTIDGRIYPKFKGKRKIDMMAENLQVTVTHTLTTYKFEGQDRKAIVLIRAPGGRLIAEYFDQSDGDDYGEEEKKDQKGDAGKGKNYDEFITKVEPTAGGKQKKAPSSVDGQDGGAEASGGGADDHSPSQEGEEGAAAGGGTSASADNQSSSQAYVATTQDGQDEGADVGASPRGQNENGHRDGAAHQGHGNEGTMAAPQTGEVQATTAKSTGGAGSTGDAQATSADKTRGATPDLQQNDADAANCACTIQ